MADEVKDKEDQYSEDRLQQECFQWAWNEFPQTRYTMFHIPNERHVHNIVEASRMKSIGVLSGAWDMSWTYGGKQFYFEFKVGKNKLSKEQERFRDAVKFQGAICFEIRRTAMFKEVVTRVVNMNTVC